MIKRLVIVRVIRDNISITRLALPYNFHLKHDKTSKLEYSILE